MIDRMTTAATFANAIRDLSRDGFLIADDFLDRTSIAELTDAVESLPADSRSSLVRRGIPFARRNLLALRFVQDLLSRLEVRELMETVAPGLVPVRAILFDKNTSANWTVPWHQDRSIAVRERIDVPDFGPWSTKAGIVHVQPPEEILREMLTLRFHLDPCGADNGPVRVIAGTHRRILDRKEVEHFIARGRQSLCTTDAGGLLLMRPLLLHASSPAKAPSHRRVLHIEFGPRDLPGGLSWAMA